jgi:C1A family cysteine protease
MTTCSIEVKKSNNKKATYKLIPHKVLDNRKRVNLKGLRPLLTISQKYRAKPLTKLSCSLRKDWPDIYDQGQIGSCTANAFCSCFKYVCPNKKFEPSRLYVYYKERLLENPDGKITDSGAFVSDAYDWVCKNGVCAELYWPYDISKVNDPPLPVCDEDAKGHTVGSLLQIKMDNDLHNTISWCIQQNKPVMLAFGVYKSFSTIGPDGLCPIPNPVNYNDANDRVDPFYGGHEVVIIGFDDEKRLYTVANSWSKEWGDNGFFYLPYDFISNPQIVYEFDVILFSHSYYDT